MSALIPLLPCTISLMRRAGTPITLAIRYCEMPIGSRNSVRRISLGADAAKACKPELLSGQTLRFRRSGAAQPLTG